MANVVIIEGTVNYDNVESFCTSEHAEIHVDGTTGKCAYEMYMDGKSGTVYINDAGREYLFPTATAHPFQIETGFTSRRYATSASQSLSVGGYRLWTQSIDSTSVTQYHSGILTDYIISTLTRDSEIRWDISVGSAVIAVGIREFYFKFYYNQYSCMAHKADDSRGVDSVSVSVTSPYQGDTVTFSAQLNSKANWKGWYADPGHHALVSREINYSVVASEDLTLYAYATKRQDVDFKINGEWKEGVALYRKENGVWTEIDKTAIDTTIGYSKRGLPNK